MATDEQLLQSLLEKIYNIVVGPDPINKVEPVGGSYVSFACLVSPLLPTISISASSS